MPKNLLKPENIAAVAHPKGSKGMPQIMKANVAVLFSPPVPPCFEASTLKGFIKDILIESI